MPEFGGLYKPMRREPSGIPVRAGSAVLMRRLAAFRWGEAVSWRFHFLWLIAVIIQLLTSPGNFEKSG